MKQVKAASRCFQYILFLHLANTYQSILENYLTVELHQIILCWPSVALPKGTLVCLSFDHWNFDFKSSFFQRMRICTLNKAKKCHGIRLPTPLVNCIFLNDNVRIAIKIHRSLFPGV